MGLFQVIKQRWTSRTRLPQIADEIAERCIDAVWHRVRQQVRKLSPAQARGYIRARGAAVVQLHLASASNRYDVVEHLRPHLQALTVEAVIQRVQRRARENSGQHQLRRVA